MRDRNGLQEQVAMNFFRLGPEAQIDFDIKYSNTQTLKGNKPVSKNVRGYANDII